MLPTGAPPFLELLLAAYNAHDVDRLVGLHAASYEGLDLCRSALQRGRGGVREDYQGWLYAFPDLRLTVTEVMALPGRAVVSWTKAGTHRGTFLQVPPTDRPIVVCGLSVLTLKDMYIVRGLHLWDMAGLLRAMRLLPDLPGAAREVSQAALLSAFLIDLERTARSAG